MAFTPTSWDFTYKKLVTPITEDVITFNAANYHSGMQVINIPDWVVVYNLIYNPATYSFSFKIKVNQAYAEAMQAGAYTGEVRFRYMASLPPFGSLQFAYLTFPLHLEVQDTITLAVNPTTFAIEYIIGDPLPQNSILQIQSENNWTVQTDQSWLSVSQTTGYLSAQISVIVNPTGLPTGNYEGLITVSGVQGLRYATVLLSVTEGDTDTNYLYLNPTNFNFLSEVGVATTQALSINLDSSHNWTAIASEPWINLSALSGNAGISDLTIGVDSTGLIVGNYAGDIAFTSNGILKTVYITHKVIAFLVAGITNDTLYFAKDRNKLLVTAAAQNSYLTIDITASHATDNDIYSEEAAYFQGLASIVIGEETKHFLKSVIPTNNFTSRIKNNIGPISLSMQVWNINKLAEQISSVSQFQNLKFLNGKTPTQANKLCYIPDTIYVSKDAVVSLSALAENNPQTITITGDVEATINSTLSNNLLVYNAIINLSPLNLSAGQTINIAFADISLDVVIVDNPVERRTIAFENEWNEYELFEIRGFITEVPDAKKLTTQLQIDGENHTKVVSIDNGITYTLNTGWIYSQAEVDWLTKILESETIFIYQGTERIEVELTTKKLERYKTRKHLKSFKLKFRKAII